MEVISESPNLKSPTCFVSPGSNPFDDFWKKTVVDTATMSEQIDRRSSFRLSSGFSVSGRKSLSFCDLNISDFGRESIGILPPDFGRDSLGFMNVNSLETDCESLGILQISALRESLGFRRESLGILNLEDMGRESLDCGRESLGILHLKSPDVKFGDEEKRIPDIILSTIKENSDDLCNILDTAFLLPHSRKSSILSSSSSINPSFNSLSLEGPSRIYSVSSTRNFKDRSDVDSSLIYSSSSVLSPLNKGKIFSPAELNSRLRIQSVPASSQDQSPLGVIPEFGDISERKFWSADRTTCLKNVERRSFHGIIDFNEADISNEFHDSVFIEGHIFAEKIADGSILNESSVGEVGVLDCTPQPEWPNDLSCSESKEIEGQKCDTETVFKTIDKMLPPPIQNMLNIKLRTSKTDSNSSNENEEKINTSEENYSKLSQSGDQNMSKLIQNISDIQHEPKKILNRKDPKEILENLSELLNCTNPSDKQKSEGQNLLNSLADMLCDSKSNIKTNLDDSGHSSINEHSDSPKDQWFDVLDLRKNIPDKLSNENYSGTSEVLDLSLKSKPIENLIEKRLSRSLCSSPNMKRMSYTGKNNGSSSSLDMNKNRTSTSSIGSNDSKNSSHLVKSQISGKLRQKHVSNVRKGPMKAVIPVGDMKKKSDAPVTPDRNEQKTSTMQSKRTSTPINEPKLKPMAASTPTAKTTKETPRLSKEPKNDTDSSSARPMNLNSSNNFTRDRAYSSTNLPRPSLANMDSKLRRNSVSIVKKSAETLRRRNSIDRESGVMSSIARIRQNIVSSPYYQSLKHNSGIKNNSHLEEKGRLRDKNHLPVNKSTNSVLKPKATTNTTPNEQNRNTTLPKNSSKINSSCRQESGRILMSPLSQVKTKTGTHERKKSFGDLAKDKENVKINRRNSVANESGMLSSLAKIRQNMLQSPYFNMSKEDPLNKNFKVLSENMGIRRTAASEFRQLKKAGKENLEK